MLSKGSSWHLYTRPARQLSYFLTPCREAHNKILTVSGVLHLGGLHGCTIRRGWGGGQDCRPEHGPVLQGVIQGLPPSKAAERRCQVPHHFLHSETQNPSVARFISNFRTVSTLQKNLSYVACVHTKEVLSNCG